MKTEIIQTDITVIGGGLAGICAAVAAARLGQTVSLIQNRPVLGGNSSSEVRVWVCGATGHGINRYARETGIMGELFVENQYRNPEGNPYYWDLLLMETVRAEKNIQLFLNTDVHEVEADGSEDNRFIRSVTGWMMGSERRIRFESSLFLDCSGDGLVGFLAGAKYRLGREARDEFNEAWAPEIADDITLGSTLLFYTKNAGLPVKFVAPSFAKDIAQTNIPLKRVIRSGDSGCHYWWIEWGGELDTVHQNEQIRDELWAVIYGIWDYIKNSGKFDADQMTLEWVGAVPGKREYRRFIGDYVLNQNDIEAQTLFEDRIAFGGWSIDLHPPQGMYAEEKGSKHLHTDGVYHIPFRSLYSSNTSNLMFAGRDISATHVAFGTTRVMATCAVIGEAAGTGAALSVQKQVTPRDISQHYITELQQLLLRQDASLLGLANEDPRDLARQSCVSASSTLKRIAVETPHEKHELHQDIGLILPVDPKLEGLELLLDVKEATTVYVEVWDTGRYENYVPAALQMKVNVNVTKGEGQWVTIPLSWQPKAPQNAFIIVRSNPQICFYASHIPQTGVLAFESQQGPSGDFSDYNKDQLVMLWSMKKWVRKPFCFRMLGETSAFSADTIVDGFVRPYGGPHMWISEPLQSGIEQWVQLDWNQPVKISEIHLTLNDDVNEDLINLHHHKTPFDIIPELWKDYSIEAEMMNGAWVTILRETDNRKRKKVHRLERAIDTKRLRVIIESTNGSLFAELIEIRVY